MQGLRGLTVRIHAILFMTMAGLGLGLVVAWQLYDTRRAEPADRQDYAAELLAHGLPAEAAHVLEEAIRQEPRSARSVRWRRVVADILIDRLGDHEKALAHLVYVRTFEPRLASETEPLIRQCMDRLGRVYDVQRRLLLADGKNPVQSSVGSATVVAFGNEGALSVSDVRRRLIQAGKPVRGAPAEEVRGLVENVAGEMLLQRAARRAGIRQDPEFLAQVRLFEENLALQRYLHDHVLKDVEVDEQALDLYLKQHQAEFSSPARVVFSQFAFVDADSAQAYVVGATPATAPVVVVDHANATIDGLPAPLRRIPWETDPVKGTLGPLETGGRWEVFEIHEVVPARRVPPDLARQQARLQLLESKQSGVLREKIAQLARQEDLKILEDVLQREFGPPASGTTPHGAPAPGGN
jgi:hypothetical protein